MTLTRSDYERLVSLAACWELWWSPAAVAYRADEAERAFAARIRAVSWDISAAIDWTDPANIPIGHAELQRRRLPWLYDPAWRCRHHRRHGHCAACATGNGPVAWRTGEPLDNRKEHAA